MFLRQVIRGMWYTMLLVDFFCSFFTYACIYFLSKKHIMTRFQLVIRRNQKNRHRQKRVYMLNGCPQKKATCFKVGFLAPKKPNSANRKVVRVVFSKARRRAFCYIPGIKHNLQKFSTVLLRGGRTKDLPGFRYKATRGVYDFKNVQNRFKARSKYGIQKLITNV